MAYGQDGEAIKFIFFYIHVNVMYISDGSFHVAVNKYTNVQIFFSNGMQRNFH